MTLVHELVITIILLLNNYSLSSKPSKITCIIFILNFLLRYQTLANGTLRINSVQEGDEGSYQCVVRNNGDSAQATGSLLLGGKNLFT